MKSPSLSAIRAIIAEPLANLVHMFRLAAPPQFCRIGIVGCGTMGTLALLLSKYRGIRDVVVQNVSGLRLQVAREMGAPAAVNVSSDEGRTELAKSQTGFRSSPGCLRHEQGTTRRFRLLPAGRYRCSARHGDR